MALKKRKLTKALFNTLSNPLSENSEKSKRTKVWFVEKTLFKQEKKCWLYALPYMHLHFCTYKLILYHLENQNFSSFSKHADY